jgi:GNAT superfamily N-acetyltransferase
MTEPLVVEVEADETYDLRRRVLRESRPASDVSFPEDHVPGALHLGVAGADGALRAVASFSPQPTPHRPDARAARLRGLAVEPPFQQAGVGRRLLDAAVERLREQGFQVVWANGRDGALGFYTRLGWRVLGDGFAISGIPHHVVLLDL